MKRKIEKKYNYLGLGFPVELNNVEMIEIDGEWHPRIDVKAVADEQIEKLIIQKTRLTGNQIKFIRSFFQMSLRDFGKAINETHAAVKKWEDFQDKQTKMDSNIEINIRLFVFNQIYKDTKENKVRFYDDYIMIKESLYEAEAR